MNCAFPTPGRLTSAQTVLFIYPVPGGAALVRAKGTERTTTDYATLLALNGTGFLNAQTPQGPRAVNFRYIIMLIASQAGTATIMMTGGQRFECSDTYASLLAQLSGFLSFEDADGLKAVNLMYVDRADEGSSDSATIVMSSGQTFSPNAGYAALASQAASCFSAAPSSEPKNAVAPVIAGDTGFGDTLTATPGTYTGYPAPVITGQWRRAGTAISGETGLTYDIAAADSEAAITYLETAMNSAGTDTMESNTITADEFAAPAISAAPTLSGTQTVGQTLTATPGTVTGSPTPTVSWEWQRFDNTTGWGAIEGANAATYTLVAADGSSYVRAVHTAQNIIGSVSAVSPSSNLIAN